MLNVERLEDRCHPSTLPYNEVVNGVAESFVWDEADMDSSNRLAALSNTAYYNGAIAGALDADAVCDAVDAYWASASSAFPAVQTSALGFNLNDLYSDPSQNVTIDPSVVNKATGLARINGLLVNSHCIGDVNTAILADINSSGTVMKVAKTLYNADTVQANAMRLKAITTEIRMIEAAIKDGRLQ